MKYGEITIIKNLEEESIFRSITRPIAVYFGCETIINKADTIILSFDDTSIYDMKNDYTNTDINYTFGTIYDNNSLYPSYFKIDNHKIDVYNKTAFYRSPIIVNDMKKLKFSEVFKDYSKFKYTTCISSVYNVIYEDIRKNVMFSIVKMTCNENNQRFMLAYDETYFDILELSYLLNCIFRNTYI